jgi:SAM-dependent methyltransferase
VNQQGRLFIKGSWKGIFTPQKTKTKFLWGPRISPLQNLCPPLSFEGEGDKEGEVDKQSQQGELKMVRPVNDRIYKLARKVAFYLPFTGLGQLRAVVERESQTILDVGCGKGERMKFIKSLGHFSSVGVDIFLPWLRACQQEKIHDHYVLCDVRHLPFRPKSFDIVLAAEVIEHLDKEDGEPFLDTLERLARRQVIITAPVGFNAYHDESDGNPYQEHRSVWEPCELKRRGYIIRGNGLRGTRGQTSIEYRLPEPFRFLWYVVTLVLGSFSYFLPHLGSNMVCTKYLTE